MKSASGLRARAGACLLAQPPDALAHSTVVSVLRTPSDASGRLAASRGRLRPPRRRSAWRPEQPRPASPGARANQHRSRGVNAPAAPRRAMRSGRVCIPLLRKSHLSSRRFFVDCSQPAGHCGHRCARVLTRSVLAFGSAPLRLPRASLRGRQAASFTSTATG